MRTIEEIKKKILCIKSEPFETSRYDRIASLNVELIAAQDAEIARLRDALKQISNSPFNNYEYSKNNLDAGFADTAYSIRVTDGHRYCGFNPCSGGR